MIQYLIKKKQLLALSTLLQSLIFVQSPVAQHSKAKSRKKLEFLSHADSEIVYHILICTCNLSSEPLAISLSIRQLAITSSGE